jgi:hypothetical protein
MPLWKPTLCIKLVYLSCLTASLLDARVVKCDRRDRFLLAPRRDARCYLQRSFQFDTVEAQTGDI